MVFKNQKSKKLIILGLIIIACIAILIIGKILSLGIIGQNNQSDDDSISVQSFENADTYIPLGDGVNIVGMESYIGAYVEDGSDDYVENVLMLTVENEGEKYIQLGRITINGQYVFELTTLLPGDSMIVLEKSKASFDENLVIESAEIDNVALFHETPSMHEELLEISGEDHLLTIKNVSNEVFVEGKVFYKNYVDDVLLGGITYSGGIPTLQPGESVQLSAGHYLEESSELMFVTYAE